MSYFPEFSDYCRACGRHIDWHTGPHNRCPDGILASRFVAIAGDVLPYQCCDCGAVLDPAAHIVYVTPERAYHCDGCARRGDVQLPAVA